MNFSTRSFIALAILLSACHKNIPTITDPNVREACHAPLRVGKPQGYKPAEWSLGLLQGSSPFQLHSIPGIKNPILTARDVTDRTARFLADPFLIRYNNLWHLFFEVMNCGTEQGDIGYATSSDLKNWSYKKVVLDEPFHLSYPHVFEHKDIFYMIPETRQAGGIRLYEATSFPSKWRYKKTLIQGNYADPSIFHYKGRWWIFAVEGGYSLAIFHSDHLEGPWQPHSHSPFYVDDKSKTRPAGRMILFNGQPIRFAQDNRKHYGHQVRAFVIDTLTPDRFEEHEIPEGTLLRPAESGWNGVGMHQVDPYQLPDGLWIAAVDGAGVYGP